MGSIIKEGTKLIIGHPGYTENNCQWINTCSVIFVKRVDKSTLLVKNGNDEIFELPTTAIAAIEVDPNDA